ncbi:MAG: glycosyltransferase family 9 protein, partial [Bacteroidales bacterium]|nr:glycosyltransferase family 9 protein [Bacteroidales bacterium]
MEEEKYIVRYLVVRFSSIGDIVLTTPVVRCLKQQVENAEIHFLTKPQNVGIVEANPYISQVHTFTTYRETVDKLRQIPFDYVIDLQKNVRSKRLINKLKILDFTFPKLNWQKWLLTSFLKINKLPDVHIVDRYLQAVRLFDVKNDMQGLDFFIPESEEV